MNLPYYLMKADLVVAVEANPNMCERMRDVFGTYISEGRLIVENCVVNVGGGADVVNFFLHRSNSVLSQFPPPPKREQEQFRKVSLPAKTLTELIERHGDPYYIKIDVEHYDSKVLSSMFDAGIFPRYVSAEAHSIDVFHVLNTLGGYTGFKLVEGRSVPRVYRRHLVRGYGKDAPFRYSFPPHSAGPFGEDVKGPWMGPEDFLIALALEGMGWKDIHACKLDEHVRLSRFTMSKYMMRYLFRGFLRY